ncbi:MAG: hydantoinase B/oxoprolinase family protein [Lentisphaerales bacterium]|nr:hydantoinase B/oxoprolinase family protein [Lentisphaerales bacterium]
MSVSENINNWKFRVDVGGTFTDYVVETPQGAIITGKILSNGIIKSIASVSGNILNDESLIKYKDDLFKGFSIKISGQPLKVLSSYKGKLVLDENLNISNAAQTYEMTSGEEAPVVVARLLTETALEEGFPAIDLRLGTTRGTNALLERKGAKVGLVCTRGFKDVWEIGTQVRPDLFDLNIKKPQALAAVNYEVTERVSSDGEVLEELNLKEIDNACLQMQKDGIESVAVCLLNSYSNPAHEKQVGEVLAKYDFSYISLSHEVSATIKYLDRGDTCLVDAYLSPIITQYVQAIKNCLPNAELRLITSSGSLVAAENFTGKDSLLSGPAGGVNGFVQAAQLAGFDKSIGFDMGGTSTDVKRFGGEYEYQYETEKAGVRVVAPMYAIETVAAGGGSICRYDGQRLLVGPESAGAFPGPACYGNGGPLTVTDVNVFCGKIDLEAFPFKLDFIAVENRLKEIAADILQNESIHMSLHEIADGFTRIADFKMAEAIRGISAAKGYEPASHAMVAFGGAGPQHACSIANILGMKDIIIHPYSGILSAFGIGVTGIHFFEERSILQPFNENSVEALEPAIANLKKHILSRMFKESVPEPAVDFEVYVGLRYKGESESLSVPVEAAVKDFEDLHLQFFGYVHKDREIECETVRVKGLASAGKFEDNIPESKKSSKSTMSQQNLWLKGEKYEVDVIPRHLLVKDQSYKGPLLVSEGLSSIVIEPGWSFKVDERNNLILSKASEEQTKIMASGIKKDPVRLELFNNIFTSIAQRMGEVLRRISLSVNIKERLDFSCAILDTEGSLIVNAPHIPVHLGALSDCVRALIKSDEKLSAGQVYLTNDPGIGGSHLPDLTVISPVFDKDEKTILFFTAIRAHHSEIGGMTPGSFCPFAESLEQEGVIFNNFLLADKAGFKKSELLKALTSAVYPSRNPEENIADLSAAQAASVYGIKELLAVIEEYGEETVLAYMSFMRETAHQKISKMLSDMEGLNKQVIDHMDDGAEVQLHAEVKGARLKLDFSKTAGVHKFTMNANKAIVKSAILYILRCILNENIPLNEGVLDPVDLVLPESFLNPSSQGEASERAAVSAGNVEVSQKLCDVLFKVFSITGASQGTMNNVVFGDDSFGFYETLGGGSGASNVQDGASAVHCHMTNTRLTDIEVIEKKYPVRIVDFAIREGSGGLGEFSGGNGMVRTYQFLKSVELSVITQRRTNEPYGMQGGLSASAGRNLFKKNDENEWRDIDPVSHLSCSTGDCLRILTPGGGGFGDRLS